MNEDKEERENTIKPILKPGSITADHAKERLKEVFGYEDFKNSVQRKSVLAILNGNYNLEEAKKFSKGAFFRCFECLHINANWIRQITLLSTSNIVS